MKTKFPVLISLVAATALMVGVAPANANTVASSTMWFAGELVDLGSESGGYKGTIRMIQESTFIPPLGDGTDGFDVFACNGAVAWYDLAGSGSANYTSGTITDHDAYLGAGGWGAWYDPDCSDWDRYQLTLGEDNTWAVEYVDGGMAHAAPISGSLDWNGMIARAQETGTGAYYASTGLTAENPGGAAGFGNTVGAWDMDWSWGSEYVPLAWGGGFEVKVMSLGGKELDQYIVSVSPVPEPGTLSLLALGLLGAAGLGIRRRASKQIH